MQGEAHDTQLTPANSDFKAEVLLLDRYRDFSDLARVLERRGPVLIMLSPGNEVRAGTGLDEILDSLED